MAKLYTHCRTHYGYEVAFRGGGRGATKNNQHGRMAGLGGGIVRPHLKDHRSPL